MSINNFLNVEIDGAGKLRVNAETLDSFGGEPAKLGPGTGVAVTVILKSDESKRCALEIPDPEATPWVASSKDASHHFRDHDHVYLVGAITAGEEPFLWAREFCIGAPT